MATTQFICVCICFIISISVNCRATGLKEVCQWEAYEAKCGDGEVIMIKEAHYGRLGVGRCQPRDFGFAGCSADVSPIMHSRCSGRQHCNVPIPDPVMFAATPCPKDLVTYLKADYECIKVAKHSTDNCDDQILTAVSGDIAKPLTTTNSYVCPQRILAQPGQTVNVYLYDFYNKDSKAETTRECISYGSIFEAGNKENKICGGEFRKNHLIYSSHSNVVDIMLKDAASHPQHYILHYEIVGCPTIHAPSNAWVKIEANTAVVMCNFSHIASELVCSNNEWVGDIHNCTSLENSLLMAVPLSVESISNIFGNTAMFVCIIIVLLCLVLFAVGLLTLIKARRLKAKDMYAISQSSVLNEKAILQESEKSFKVVDDYQPSYLPMSPNNYSLYAPIHQNELFDGPLNGDLTALHAPRVPVVENPYGRFSSTRVAPAHNCSHSIYNITGLTVSDDNVINIEGSLIS